MQLLALVLFLTHLISACFPLANSLNSVSCSPGLGCQLKKKDPPCIPSEPRSDPELDPILRLIQMNPRNTLWCPEEGDCIPCVQVMLTLGLLGPSALGAKQDGGANKIREQPKGHPKKIPRTHIFLMAETYSSLSRCVEVEVWLPYDWESQNNSLGSLQYNCFPIALSGELHLRVFMRPHYHSTGVLQVMHHGPDCTWPKATDAIHLCQVPRLATSVGLQSAILHVQNVPKGLHFKLWLYLNRTDGLQGLDQGTPKLLTGSENVSLPISQVFPCLCFQVWPKIEDQADTPRTHLCPFVNDRAALARAWAHSRLEVHPSRESLSCLVSAPCDLQGELVPCWRMEELACHPLHPHLHLALIPNEPQEFPRLRPHPNLCVQVRRNGSTYLQSCLQDDVPKSQQYLLFQEIRDTQGNLLVQIMEQGTWVSPAQVSNTRRRRLEEDLRKSMQLGKCTEVWQEEGTNATIFWACSVEHYPRTYWVLIWLVTLLGSCCVLLMLLFKKEAVKGWFKILKEDYSSRGMLQGRQVLILYSPDHEGYERVVGVLADALTQLQASVSLELWSRGELGSLGPMQWFHAQRHLVLQEGGVIVLLFSHGAVASCAEWLGWKQNFLRSAVKPDSTFLASLNCVLPDFLAGEARATYIVSCFEELLPVSEIPELFCSVPVYPLPSQLFSFLLDLAGPRVGHQQRISLKRHAGCIRKSLEQAAHECQQKYPS
ncbi:interleukin-17 receptor C isoform X2 [Pseudonaja textilis]|uniref:interleukin-17 receptor C isoform X2 n=1 Tax=Pseudonaja textilis TaxID=8673 RepID=UPI000EA9CBDE|nr:interleukin-17 receptor C isoform X2 [Pseudonaja textilis]